MKVKGRSLWMTLVSKDLMQKLQGRRGRASAFWASFHTFQFYFNPLPHTFFKACAVVGIVEQAEQKPCPHGAYMLMEKDCK